MLKIIALIFLVLLIAGCSGNGEDIQLPPEVTPYEQEYTGNYEPAYEDEEPEEEEELPPLLPDIPRYNKYWVSLEVNPYERTVLGVSHITFTNRADVPLETIVLRVYLNAFSEGAQTLPVFRELEWRAFPNGRDYGYMDIQYAFIDNAPLDFELNETILTLYLPEPLEPYASMQLLLQHSARIPQIAHRTGGNEHALWFGMFLPVLAVFTGDGWHTEAHYPAGSPFFLETANYNVEIITPIRYVVVGTGLRTEEVIRDTDTKITRFIAHQARDFAFAVSPYFRHAYIATESGIGIYLYYYTETLLVDEILDSARRSIEYFEKRIGTYPFGHVTIIEAELMQDSLSFSQIVFVDSWYLGRGGRFWALAHGLGNQWFANAVGTNRVAEPWLTEGLTRFVQTGIFYQQPDALRARMERDHASIEDRASLYLAYGLDASPNWTHYAHTHGRKAMLMVYALHHRMGDEVFWEFIANYYQTFFFNIADAEDFINLAEEAYGESLRDFFDEWFTTGTVPDLP